MISFPSVPSPVHEAACDLFSATQQMALALLITDIETAEIAVSRYNKVRSNLTASELLDWAINIRSIGAFQKEWIEALLTPTLPELNTDPGFFTSVLTSTKVPNWKYIAMCNLLEEICDDSIKEKIELLASNKKELLKEMIARGLRYPNDLSAKYNLSEEDCKEFLEVQKVKEYLSEWKSRKIFNAGTKNARKYFLVKDLEKKTTLVRARSLTEAENTVEEGKGLEIDYSTWIYLGGR